MRRAVSVLACAVALVAGPGACGDDSGGEGETARATEELEAVMLDEGPPGFRPATAADGLPGGAFDLDTFLEQYSAAPDDDRRRFTKHGFAAGFTRTWLDDETQAVATVIALAFENAAGAKTVQKALADEALPADGESFPVPDIPGAVGVTGTQQTDGGAQYVRAVSFTSGPRLFTVALVTSGPSPGEAETLLALAVRQAARK